MTDPLSPTKILRSVGDAKNLRIEEDGMTAEDLREALVRLDLTQTEAARRLRVSLRTVQNWCAGHHEVPGPVEVLVETWLRHPELLQEADDG